MKTFILYAVVLASLVGCGTSKQPLPADPKQSTDKQAPDVSGGDLTGLRAKETFSGDDATLLLYREPQPHGWVDVVRTDSERKTTPYSNAPACIIATRGKDIVERPGQDFTTDAQGRVRFSMANEMFQASRMIYRSSAFPPGENAFALADFWIFPLRCDAVPFGSSIKKIAERQLQPAGINLRDWNGYGALYQARRVMGEQLAEASDRDLRKPHEALISKCKNGDAGACYECVSYTTCDEATVTNCRAGRGGEQTCQRCVHSSCAYFYALENSGKSSLFRACDLHHARACDEIKAAEKVRANSVQEAAHPPPSAQSSPGRPLDVCLSRCTDPSNSIVVMCRNHVNATAAQCRQLCEDTCRDTYR